MTANNGRFQKGLVPWNKGKEMRASTREKLLPTLFKKGNRPHTWVPVGTVYVSKRDGFQRVKVSDDMILPREVRWRLVHHLLWEQHHGPIPPGHIVRFRDGNVSNVVIENLECITRAENRKRNSIQAMPPELANVARTIGVLKRVIGNKNKNHGKEQAI